MPKTKKNQLNLRYKINNYNNPAIMNPAGLGALSGKYKSKKSKRSNKNG